MKQLYTALLLSTALSGTAHAQDIQIGSTTVTIDTIAYANVPWEIYLENDDYMWMTERHGIVSRIDLNTGVKTTMLDLTGSIVAESESGLLGLVLHPAFSVTQEVFLVYTHGPIDGDGYYFERLVKYTFNGEDSLINPEILVDNIPAWINHAGSRLFMLPDQTILMSTGERYQSELAQDSSSLAGKYLRVTLDGEIPTDNPDSTSYIYSMGHRNSQGITSLPDGTIIISEHGPSTDDELSILEAGNNYGWPLIHGFCDETFEDAPCATGLYTEPIYHWTPTIAVSDLIYYENPSFPEWDGRLLMTTLNGQRLVTMDIDTDTYVITDEDQYFQGQFGRLRDIAVSTDKKIYIATNTGANNQHPILRITPPFSGLNVNELSEKPFVIYPNPAADYVTVDLALQNATVRILDLNGREVMKKEHVETDDKISLLNLQQGIYMLEVSQPGMAPSQQRLEKI